MGVGKQFVNKEPLTLCYCGNHGPPETPPDAGAAAWVWFAPSWGQRKGKARASVTPPRPPASPKLDLLLLGLCAGGWAREDVRLPAELSSSFKVKFPSELALSPHPQPLGSQAAGRAGTRVPAAVGLLPSRCLSRRALQPVISIDLFWRQFVARRVCGQEGRGLGWGGGEAREVELPSEAGRPSGPGPGPSCVPPHLRGVQMCSASADGRKEATLHCRGSWSHSGSKQHAGAGLLLRPSAKIDFARPCFPFHGTKWEAGAGETSGQWPGP